VDCEERFGRQGQELNRWSRAAVAAFFAAGAALVWAPPPVQRAEAWLRYRLLGEVPSPLLIGRNGRIFLANHAAGELGSMITAICGGSVDDAGVARAAAHIRPILAAARAIGVPVRFVIVPTAPRLYTEDLPLAYAHACDPPNVPAADRLVALLHDPDVIYPLPLMLGLKTQFEVLPRHHFHWAGQGPLHVAEAVAEQMGLKRTLTLPLRNINRSSDLDNLNPGMGEHDRIRDPDLRAGKVTFCIGARCPDKLPGSILDYTRTVPAPGRILVMADSFGDEIGADFIEYVGRVWLLRMNVAIGEPAGLLAATALRTFKPDAIVIVYHDAGTLVLDPGSQASFAALLAILRNQPLPSASASP
jgi:hypothetical protein